MMSIVRFDGQQIFATPISVLDDGNWLFMAQTHTPRGSIGTVIKVAPQDIVSMSREELPTDIQKLLGDKMPGEIDGLTDLVKTVSDLKALASNTAQRFQTSVNSVKEAITHADSLSTQLEKSASELRGALGLQTNNPPA